MRVSVLIGAYDNADTLPRAIESILSQTLGDLELIVVDDGSMDGTAELVDEVADPRVRRLGLPHLGISRSLNAGMAEARAPLVAIQDADDWSHPDRLEREVGLLAARPDVAVVGCRMQEVGPEGKALAPRTSFTPGDVGRALLRFNPIPNSCVCFRRAEVMSLGGYDPRLRYSMDYDLWLRVAEHHTVWTLDDTLAVRTMSGVNVAARKERDQIAETTRILAATAWRRRSAAGLPWLAPPAISWATPLPLKRAVRRRLGQAP